jgi:hypothetical protein
VGFPGSAAMQNDDSELMVWCIVATDGEGRWAAILDTILDTHMTDSAGQELAWEVSTAPGLSFSLTSGNCIL